MTTLIAKCTWATSAKRQLISKKISVLDHMRSMLPMLAKLQLYKLAIWPNLPYCHTVWYLCCASDARKLSRLQEFALRIVFADRTAPYKWRTFKQG